LGKDKHKRKGKYKRKWPKGCGQCPERFTCRYIKINDVLRCKKRQDRMKMIL